MAEGDPGVIFMADADKDISVEQGERANFRLPVQRVNGYLGPIYAKEMLITNPAFQTFEFLGMPDYPIPPPSEDYPSGDGWITLSIDTKSWPPGGYHLEVMAYDGVEPQAPI